MVERMRMEDTRGGGGCQFTSWRAPQYFITRSTQIITECGLNIRSVPFGSLDLVTIFVGLIYDK